MPTVQHHTAISVNMFCWVRIVYNNPDVACAVRYSCAYCTFKNKRAKDEIVIRRWRKWHSAPDSVASLCTTQPNICNPAAHSYTFRGAPCHPLQQQQEEKTPSQTFFRVTNFLFVTFSLLFSWIRTKLTTRKMYTKIQRNLLHPCQHIKI